MFNDLKTYLILFLNYSIKQLVTSTLLDVVKSLEHISSAGGTDTF